MTWDEEGGKGSHCDTISLVSLARQRIVLHCATFGSFCWPRILFHIVPHSFLLLGRKQILFELCHNGVLLLARQQVLLLHCATFGCFCWRDSIFFRIVPHSVFQVGREHILVALCTCGCFGFFSIGLVSDCFLHKLMTLGTRHVIQLW